MIHANIRAESISGFTMIELLIGLALLGVALASSWLLYSFGFASFCRGEHQTAKQQSVRLAAKILSEEIRNAKQITFIRKDHSDDWIYIYVDDDGNVVRSDRGIIVETPKDTKITLYFCRVHDAKNIIDFVVGIVSEDEEYNIESSVFARNLPTPLWQALNPSSGSVLGYKL